MSIISHDLYVIMQAASLCCIQLPDRLLLFAPIMRAEDVYIAKGERQIEKVGQISRKFTRIDDDALTKLNGVA